MLQSIVLGWGFLSALLFICASTGFYYQKSLRILFIILVLGSLPNLPKLFNISTSFKIKKHHLIIYVILFLVIGLNLSVALLPPQNFDALEYHLGVQSQYLLAGKFFDLPYMMYANFPQNMELIYGASMAIWDDTAVKIIHWWMGLLTFAGIYLLGRKIHSEKAGFWGGFIFYTCGEIGLLSNQANIDLGVSFLASVILITLVEWWETRKRSEIIILGIVLGIALGTKLTTLIILIFPLAASTLIIGPRPRISKWLIVVSLAAILFIPWLIKTFIFTGNPFFPFGFDLFGGDHWTEVNSALERAAHSPDWSKGIVNIIIDPFIRIYRSIPLSPYLFILFLPVIFTIKWTRQIKFLLLFTGFGTLAWILFSKHQIRFLVPLLVPWSVVLGTAVQEVKSIRIRRILQTILLLTALLPTFWIWKSVEILDFRLYLSGILDKEEYLLRPLPHFEEIYHANKTLPKGDTKILFVGESRVHGLEHPAIVSSVFDPSPLLIWANQYKSVEKLAEILQQNNITHIIYNQIEIQRLHRMYRHLGWREGQPLMGVIETLQQTGWIKLLHSSRGNNVNQKVYLYKVITLDEYYNVTRLKNNLSIESQNY